MEVEFDPLIPLLLSPTTHVPHHDGRQRDLFNVLKAYSAYRKEIGYCQVCMRRLPIFVNVDTIHCVLFDLHTVHMFAHHVRCPSSLPLSFLPHPQGMGMVAATLLMYMPAPQAFWTLVALLDSPNYLRYACMRRETVRFGAVSAG